MPTTYMPTPNRKVGEELSSAAEVGAMEDVAHKERSVLAELKIVLKTLIIMAD